MPSTRLFLFGFLVPGLVFGGISLANALARGTGDAARRRGDFAGAWALGLAYLVAHVVIAGVPPWPSPERALTALQWLAWTVVLALAASPLYFLPIARRSAVRIVRVGAALAFVLLTLHRWVSGQPGATWIGVLVFALVLLVWESTDALVERSPGPVPVLALFVAMCSASIAALLAHSALVAELAGAMCVALGAGAVTARLSSRFQLSAGAVAIFVLVFAGVLENGVLFADMHWSSAACAMLAVVAPWLAEAAPRPSRGPWTSAVIRAAVAALFGAAAIAAAHFNTPSYD
jgi:hypothetical protein